MLLKQVLREKMYYIIVIYKMLYIYILFCSKYLFTKHENNQQSINIFIIPSHTRDYLNKVAKIYNI